MISLLICNQVSAILFTPCLNISCSFHMNHLYLHYGEPLDINVILLLWTQIEPPLIWFSKLYMLTWASKFVVMHPWEADILIYLLYCRAKASRYLMARDTWYHVTRKYDSCQSYVCLILQLVIMFVCLFFKARFLSVTLTVLELAL